MRKSLALNVALLILSCHAMLLASGNGKNADPEVAVRVSHSGLIPGPTLRQGQTVAKRIMATAGVHVRWGYDGSKTESQVCGGAVQTIELGFFLHVTGQARWPRRFRSLTATFALQCSSIACRISLRGIAFPRICFSDTRWPMRSAMSCSKTTATPKPGL